MDKVSVIKEILRIFHSEQYPSETETIATITALSNINCDESFQEILNLYENSIKSSDMRIATITAISNLHTNDEY